MENIYLFPEGTKPLLRKSLNVALWAIFPISGTFCIHLLQGFLLTSCNGVIGLVRTQFLSLCAGTHLSFLIPDSDKQHLLCSLWPTGPTFHLGLSFFWVGWPLKMEALCSSEVWVTTCWIHSTIPIWLQSSVMWCQRFWRTWCFQHQGLRVGCMWGKWYG
jgi:hypothetical protein